MSVSRSPSITPEVLNELRTVVGERGVMTEPKVLAAMSQDHYWFSPVLKPELEDKLAEVIVQPNTVEELVEVVALAYRHDLPVTTRGSGTGNYGQGMPMQGGVVLSTHGLKEILELTPEGARVGAGVRLGTLEREARKKNAELRMYPSTFMTATAGGFLAGGAGGVGSVTWGTLWDEGNVLAATVVTMEREPKVLHVEGHEALQSVIHSCGLTCIIVDLTFALAPAQAWGQYTAVFDTFEDALHCGETLAYDETIKKRLISLHEWPIPTFFGKLARGGLTRDGKALALLELTLDPRALEAIVRAHGGELTWHGPPETYLGGAIKLSDFSWNHTTLWAIKADPSITYLQDAYDRERVLEQLRTRREEFPGELLHHIEFMRFGGPPYPQGMTLVRFHSEARLREIQAFTESIGMNDADAHSHKLDDDVRWNGEPILDAKRRWDPKGLLNPGHLNALEEV